MSMIFNAIDLSLMQGGHALHTDLARRLIGMIWEAIMLPVVY